jgi:hypothetical protein
METEIYYVEEKAYFAKFYSNSVSAVSSNFAWNISTMYMLRTQKENNAFLWF